MSTAGRILTSDAIEERSRQAVVLTLAGWSAAEIAVRLGMSQRTVVRYRARRRQS